MPHMSAPVIGKLCTKESLVESVIEILGKIPATAWVALIVALLTSLLTLLGVRYTNKGNNERLKIQLEHDQKVKREELIRTRLEELYVESTKYMDKMTIHFLPYRRVMKGEITYNQALDLTLESKIDYDPIRVKMIMDMYFPALNATFKEVEKSLDRASKIQHGFKLQYKQGNPDGEKWLPLFQESLEDLAESTSAFKKHVAQIAKST